MTLFNLTLSLLSAALIVLAGDVLIICSVTKALEKDKK